MVCENTSLLRGDETAHPEALEAMQNSPANHPTTQWAAYQNQDLSHPHLGHLKFLAVGPHNTLSKPPLRHPDMPTESFWRYVLVGWVNLTSGQILPLG